MRTPALALAAIGCISWRRPSAEHAKINLDVSASGEQVTAFVDQTPPEHGKNPRPVIKARAGEPIKVQFLLTNVYPHKTLENVVVHFYIARAGQAAGQKPTPDLGRRGGRGAGVGLRDGLQARRQGRGPEHPPGRQAGRLPRPRRDPPDRERPRALRRRRPRRSEAARP